VSAYLSLRRYAFGDQMIKHTGKREEAALISELLNSERGTWGRRNVVIYQGSFSCKHAWRRVFMSANPIPAGFHTLVPNIIVESVDAAASFYKRAFGAEDILRLSMPDGKGVHCELKFGDSRVNLGESMEGWPEHTLLTQIFVADSGAVFAQAVKAGAKALSPMTDMFFGSRARPRSIR